MTRTYIRLSLLALLAISLACNDSGPTIPQAGAAFTLSTAGSTTMELTGTTLSLPTQLVAYRETVNGREYVVDLTPVVLVQSITTLASSSQLTMNVFGRLETGTYRVHREGTVPSATSLQARLIIPVGADHEDTFFLDDGSITVTSLNPFTATFRFTGTQRIRRPREVQIGQSATSVPAPITVTGRIGAPQSTTRRRLGRCLYRSTTATTSAGRPPPASRCSRGRWEHRILDRPPSEIPILTGSRDGIPQ